MSDQTLLREVVVSPRRAYLPFPGLQVVERPGWSQLIAPAFKTGGFNEVCLAVLDQRDADQIIDATIAEYRALGIAFRWKVGPDSGPVNLAERLEHRGLRRTQVLGMARASSCELAHTPGIEVTVVDHSNVATFNAVMAHGWAMELGPLEQVHECLLRDPTGRQQLLLATRDGAPAGVASAFFFERSAYLLGAVVLPEHRKAGVYRALVQARLREANRRGLQVATSHASAGSSAPLLAKMGFEVVCSFSSFAG